MRNTLYYLSLITILFTYLFLFYLAFLMFFPTNSFQVLRNPTVPNQKEYKKGDIVSFMVSVCRNNDNQGTVERIIRNVDNQLIAYSIAKIPLIAKPFKCGEYNVVVPTPMNMVSGTYVIETTIRIQANILREEVYTSKTLPFRIK